MKHEDAWERLPALAAHTLAEPERRLVDEHCAECPTCRAELASWMELRDAERELSAAAPPLPPHLLHRALAQIDGAESHRSTWWASLSLWRAAVAIQFSLLLLLGGYAWKTARERPYTVLGEQGTVRPGESLVDIRFNPAATEDQIRSALDEVRGRIVDGPSALGIYTIAVPHQQAAAAVAGLRARKPVIEFAEAHP